MKKFVQEINIHDHTCFMFNSQAELVPCVITFVSEGLNRNEKCLIVVDDMRNSEILKNIEVVYEEVVKKLKKPNLLRTIMIETFKKVYLKDNIFNMEVAGKYYLAQVDQALKEGYSGFRVFAELSNSLKTINDINDFLRWEEKADKFFPKTKFSAVCAYSKQLFSDEYIQEAINIHPIEVMA